MDRWRSRLSVETLSQLGLLGLFVAAFLAGTVIAFGSEAVLVGLLLLEVSPVAAVVVATVGNVLGSITVYLIGRAIVRGRGLEHRFFDRWRQTDERKLERARRWIERWGPLSLTLAWLPVVGDALVLGAGIALLDWLRVVIFVTLGKAARYVAVAWLTLAATT